MATLVKNGLLLAASTTISVLAAEGAARLIAGPAERHEMAEFRLKDSGYYMPDGELGWVPRPGQQATFDRAGSSHSSFSTNSLGLRDDELATDHRSRATRIVALGDSFTWGFGVDDREVYTAVVEELAPRVEVVNLGVTAYGLGQEIAYFERLGRSMKPDIVLLALVMNDIADANRLLPGETTQEWRDRIASRSSNAGTRGSEGPAADSAWSVLRVKRALAAHSVLYRLLTSVINSHKVLVDLLVSVGIKGPPVGLEGLDWNLHPFLRTYPASVRASVEQTKRELLDLRERVRESGGKLLVVVVPALQSVDDRARRSSIANTRYHEDDFDIDKPYRWLREWGGAVGMEILIPVEAFREAKADGAELYLPHDMHFSAAGHRLFAVLIAGFLREKAWIDE